MCAAAIVECVSHGVSHTSRGDECGVRSGGRESPGFGWIAMGRGFRGLTFPAPKMFQGSPPFVLKIGIRKTVSRRGAKRAESEQI